MGGYRVHALVMRTRKVQGEAIRPSWSSSGQVNICGVALMKVFHLQTVTDVLLEYDMLPSLKLRLLNYPLLLILELPKVNMHVVASCGSSTQLCMSDKYTYYVPELMKSSLLSTHHI